MKFALCAAISLLAALPAQAAVLECKIVQRNSAWGWFAPTIKFEYDEGSDEATVTDAVIKDRRGKSVQAEIDIDTPSRTTFIWSVTAKSIDKQFKAEGDAAGGLTTFSKVRFRLTHFKGEGTASISAISGNAYLDEPTSEGTCKFIG